MDAKETGGDIFKNLPILVVDDNAVFCASLERALHQKGYDHVRTATDAYQALDIVRDQEPSLVLCDLYLPGMDGLHLLTAIHKINRSIPVLMLSCEADDECIKAAVSLGAADYIVKPFHLASLLSSVELRLADLPA